MQWDRNMSASPWTEMSFRARWVLKMTFGAQFSAVSAVLGFKRRVPVTKSPRDRSILTSSTSETRHLSPRQLFSAPRSSFPSSLFSFYSPLFPPFLSSSPFTCPSPPPSVPSYAIPKSCTQPAADLAHSSTHPCYARCPAPTSPTLISRSASRVPRRRR